MHILHTYTYTHTHSKKVDFVILQFFTSPFLSKHSSRNFCQIFKVFAKVKKLPSIILWKLLKKNWSKCQYSIKFWNQKKQTDIYTKFNYLQGQITHAKFEGKLFRTFKWKLNNLSLKIVDKFECSICIQSISPELIDPPTNVTSYPWCWVFWSWWSVSR